MSQRISVEVKNLVKRFGDFTAVDHVSFRVKEGEIFGFLGSNGAGKSTTIRMLCGLLRPTEGEARVAGYDVYNQPEQIKNHIGYMSQKFSLYDELTVEENIDFFSGAYGLSGSRQRQRKEFILEMMDLRAKRGAATRLLPGGWKQRLALGCAILHEPAILFLDEPTSGVDPIARRAFWELIYQLSRKGHTLFVTTHYMDEAEYCNRLALMHAARIIALDSPGHLRETATADEFMQLDCSDTLTAMKLLEEPEQILDVAVFEGGLHLRVKEAAEAEKIVRRRLAEHQIEIRELKAIQPSIEDIFVSLIEAEERRQHES